MGGTHVTAETVAGWMERVEPGHRHGGLGGAQTLLVLRAGGPMTAAQLAVARGVALEVVCEHLGELASGRYVVTDGQVWAGVSPACRGRSGVPPVT